MAGTDSSRPWAFDLYLGAVGAVAFATAWRALVRPTPPSTHSDRKELMMARIVIDRSLCSGFGSCAELAPHLFQLDREGFAALRVGTTDDQAAHDAAASCPMGAITVIEEKAA